MKSSPAAFYDSLKNAMKNSLSVISALSVTLTLVTISFGQDRSTPLSPAILKLKQAIGYEVDQKKIPAFSIALVDGENVVWSQGFGFQDAKREVPATADTVYRVGSVSKLFTDIAVMQLVEEGKLTLDAPVQQFVPQFNPRNEFGIQITLRQLMSHRSGLVRESPVGNYFDPTQPSLSETIASLNATSLVYKPDSRTKYSNAAIAVVGSILESQLDESHPERVKKTILSPLGMNNSSFEATPDIQSKLAAGWMWTYDGRRFVAPEFLLGTGPAGNMYSSVLDLSKFIGCLFREGETATGRILTRESLALMTTPIRDADGKSQGFGLGFSVSKLDGFTMIGHGGAVYGFSTELAVLPQQKLGVVAASALDGSNPLVERLTEYALRLMLANKNNQPLPNYSTTVAIDRPRALSMVGDYQQVEGDEVVHVSEMNGEVHLQRGTYRNALRANEGDGSIVTDDVLGYGTKIEITAPDSIKIGVKSYKRNESRPPADIPDRWKGLIGEYGWDHNTLYILEDHGKLVALIEWFYTYPLTEISENVFAFPDYGLYHGERLEFVRDHSGMATEVVAAEVRFPRREVGTKDGETFKIVPLQPIDSLRAVALAASPPLEKGDFTESQLMELAPLDPTLKLDIRYATTNNFTGALFYQQPRAFMQAPAAAAVIRIHQRLKSEGLGLLIHDAYRPWHVTKMFWDATPDTMKDFVANPANGSRHNRGCAVDLSLYDLKSGEPIQMVAGYDEFSNRSFPMYPGGTSRQRWYRYRLRQAMEAEGFKVYEFEWWHFDYKDWNQYRIGNVTFEKIDAQ